MALEVEKVLAKEAEEKQKAQGGQGQKGAEFGALGGRNNKNPLVEKIPQGGLGQKPAIEKKEAEPKARDKAAEAVGGTNARYWLKIIP